MQTRKTPDLFRLDGRTALITGAAGHLGEAMARGLAEAGARVLLNGRNTDKLDVLASALQVEGLEADVLSFDILDLDAAKTAIAGLERLDILVNNAYTGRPGALETANQEDFEIAYRCTVMAPFEMARAGLPAFATAVAATGGASIVNIGTMYASVSPDPGVYGASGLNNPPFYGPAKAGLLQMTRYLATHLADQKIRVNAISPGPFPNPDIQKKRPDFVARLEDKTPMKRIAEPDELKGAVTFLASDASSYVTGINLPVDGGWTAW